MPDKTPTEPLVIRLATPDDIAIIEELDAFSSSPTRDIHRDIEKYFGSVDPSTHERTLIFLVERKTIAMAKAELMLPPPESIAQVGYIKRVVVHPDFRKQGLSHELMQYILHYAHHNLGLAALDLHVWEDNSAAIHLYQSLGFELQHRELYFRLAL